MCRLYAVVAALFLLLVPPCADTTVGRGAGVAATAHVVHGRSLKRIFDIRTTENHAGVDVPGYMYDLYRDAGNRRYNAIRSIAPRTESLGTYTQLVYDLNALEPTEVVQKVILQLETGPKFRFPKAVNVSVYCVYNRTASRTYLGSASLVDSLDLKNTLGSKLLVGIEQLIVQTDGRARNPSIGLVLYSTTRVDGASEKGHELSEFLYETTNRRRRRRSVIDNEIDIKRNGFADELKRKKKKKKSSRVSKLQAVDTGDTIVFANTDQCRMEKLSLNFADIGWEDWVIYPKGFETNYCAGGCLFPLGKASKPTNHATVQSLARSFGRLWDIPEPSCVPDTLAPLTLLYMDRANHVLLKSYPDMRVITCACK